MGYPKTGNEVFVSFSLSNTMLSGIGKGTITREDVSADYLKNLFAKYGVIVSAKPEQRRLLELVNEMYGLELEISFPVVSSSDVSYGAGTVGVSQAPTTLIIPSGENNVSYDINWYVRNDTEGLAVKVNLKTNPDEKYLYGNLSDVIEIDFFTYNTFVICDVKIASTFCVS